MSPFSINTVPGKDELNAFELFKYDSTRPNNQHARLELVPKNNIRFVFFFESTQALCYANILLPPYHQITRVPDTLINFIFH